MAKKPLVATVLLIGLAGCGGMSRDELEAEANKICVAAEKKSSTDEPVNTAELQEFAKQNAAATSDEIEQLSELEPPEELKAKYEQMLDSLREKRDLTEELGKAAAAEDLAKLQEIVADAEKGRAEHVKITKDLGFEDCVPT